MTAFVSRIAHSLMLRLVFLMLTLGALIVAVLLVSWLVFRTIDAQMASLTSERLPELRGSAGVVASTDAMRALLTSSLAAATPEALEEQMRAATHIFATFNSALDQLPPEEAEIMHPILKDAADAVNELLVAREREFSDISAMAEAIRTAFQDASTASSLIEEANDTAIFDMTISGEDTITVIDETLTRLVEEDFQQFQTALSIRGEINLIAGLAIAFGQSASSGQSQINSILGDLATSATDRLEVLLDQNEGTPALETVLPPLGEAIAIFKRVFEDGRNAPGSSDILAARLAVDTVLSPALDDIYFNFIIANDEAKETNRASLSRLLEVEVEGMRRNASLDAATKHFFALLLQISSARSLAELELVQRELTAQAEDVVRLKADTAFESQENLLNLLRLAEAENGLGVLRKAIFDAQTLALSASRQATEAVDAIALETSHFSATALAKIEEAASFLDGTLKDARLNLTQIAYLALAVMFVVPVLLWYTVTRPIGRVTLVTERLAGGDLSEIEGLSTNEGELGRMASALHVFRNGALKSIKLQEDKRRQERAAMEAEQQAEKERLAEERRRADEAARRQEEERAQEAQRAAEADERQRQEIAQRTARLEEQAHIVKTLAKGLNDLSLGDLTCKIDTSFPEAYDALRLDFNAAIEKLSQIVEQLKGSSETIERNCGEIASASDDLALRTEQSASTLAETVTSVSALSTSVAEAASNAGEASSTIQGIREKANLNNEVMAKAKSAMGRVEDASGKITSIVGIIDSIAFQTNLLALNAGVEAARAGSAGQGFAVVANEVRVLAQRCSDAASEIGEVVEQSTATVREGVDLTAEANEAMAAISDGIDQISQITDDMARSATQQAQGLEDVNMAIQNLDKSTQQNAAMFEETTAANQLLTSEASALSGVVKSFKPSDAGADARAIPAQTPSEKLAS